MYAFFFNIRSFFYILFREYHSLVHLFLNMLSYLKFTCVMLGLIENNVLGIYLMHVHMPDIYYHIHLYTNAKQKKEKRKQILIVTRFEPVSFKILDLEVLCYTYLTLLLRQILFLSIPNRTCP